MPKETSADSLGVKMRMVYTVDFIESQPRTLELLHFIFLIPDEKKMKLKEPCEFNAK
jgi:hypothetical protein